MKNFYLFLILICGLSACQSAEPITGEAPSTSVRNVVTRVAITGDIELGQPLPMYANFGAKSVTNHIYGVQVYTRPMTPSTSSYKPFAYGMFDDLSKIVIELPDNMLYRFCITMVADGKSRVASNQGDYYDPFGVGSRLFSINNTFAYSSTTVLAGIFTGKTAVKDASAFGYTVYARPNVDRYSGETVDFQPAEGVNVEVELKRVVFGIRLTAIGLSDGYVELNIDGAPSMKIVPGQDKVEEVFTLQGSGTANIWLDENYTETVVFKAKWVKGDNSEIILGPAAGRQLLLKRKQMYPVSARVVWDSVNGDITMEDGTMIDQPETVF